ncbi:protein of unknown function [Burkholderia multivorans]
MAIGHRNDAGRQLFSAITRGRGCDPGERSGLQMAARENETDSIAQPGEDGVGGAGLNGLLTGLGTYAKE